MHSIHTFNVTGDGGGRASRANADANDLHHNVSTFWSIKSHRSRPGLNQAQRDCIKTILLVSNRSAQIATDAEMAPAARAVLQVAPPQVADVDAESGGEDDAVDGGHCTEEVALAARQRLSASRSQHHLPEMPPEVWLYILTMLRKADIAGRAAYTCTA